MKKLLLLSAVALISTSANAVEIKPYLEGKISENMMKAKYQDPDFSQKFSDTGVLGGSIEVGVKLDQFRVGLEGYYNDKMKDTINYGIYAPAELETKGFFLNGYYDFKLPNIEKIKPYVGVGIGYSWMKETAKFSQYGFDDESAKDKDLGYQLGLGIGYEITENIDLSLGYRYENLGKIKNEDIDSETKITNHKVSLGLRYEF